MKTFRTFASAIATIATLFAFTGCNDEGKDNGTPEKPVVEKKDVVFNVKVKDITKERATITITHNGEKNYTWHGFWYTDVETSVESAIAREITSLKDNNKSLEGILSNGAINKAFVKNLDSKTTYRYVVFGINEDGTQYGTPASVDFDTERIDATFSITVKNQTPESVKIGVTSGSGYPDDTWYAFCIEYKGGDFEDIVEDAVAALGNDIASALKSGSQNVEFKGLNPGTKYAVGVVGLLADGTIYGEGDDSLVELEDVTFALTVGEKTDTSIPVTVVPSYTSETTTWFAFCTPDNGASIAAIIDEQIASLGNNIAPALKYGRANLTFDNLTPANYVIAVVGLRADGTVYGTPAYKKVDLSLVYKQNSNWVVSYTGQDEDGYENVHVEVKAGSDRFVVSVYDAATFAQFSIEDIIDNAAEEYLDFIDYAYEYFGGNYSKETLHSLFSYTEDADEGFNLPAGDYVGLAFGMDDAFNITGLYQTGTFTVEEPEVDDKYYDFIGDWMVTTESSDPEDGDGEPISFPISISEKVAGSSYVVEGWASFMGDYSTAEAKYNNGVFSMQNQQDLKVSAGSCNSGGGAVSCYLLSYCETADGSYATYVTGTNFDAISGSMQSNGTVKLFGAEDIELNNGKVVNVVAFDFYALCSIHVHLFNGVYGYGPYTLTKTSGSSVKAAKSETKAMKGASKVMKPMKNYAVSFNEYAKIAGTPVRAK